MMMTEALALADKGIEEPLKMQVEEAESASGRMWTTTRLRDFFGLDERRLRGRRLGKCHFCEEKISKGRSYFHAYNESHWGWEHLVCWLAHNRATEKTKENGSPPSGNGNGKV